MISPRRLLRLAAASSIAALPFTATVAEAKPRVAFATCYNLSGITASGLPVGKRVAASNVWPLGTRFTITGDQAGPGGIRRYVVRDTGGALGDGHFDLWYDGPCAWWGWRRLEYQLGWTSD